jgi:hypothetical protein
MPADTPLLTAISMIVSHTPTYVWFILAALVVLGSLQLRNHVMSRGRLAIAPVALGAFSLWGATLAFGARTEVIACWALGIGLAIVANRWLRWPRSVRLDGSGGYALAGSPWPLILMLAIFALRYTVAVTLAFHPAWARDPAFSLAMAAVYGAVSGLFTARALRILRSATPAGRLATA